MSGGSGRARASWVPHLAVLALILVLAMLPQLAHLPIPAGAMRLTQAQFSFEGEAARPVALPHRWPRAVGFGPRRGTYRLTVDLSAFREAVLLIPAAQHALTVRVDGRRLPGSDLQPWGEPVIGSAYVLPLPSGQAGPVALEIVVDRESGGVRGYLSPLYLAEEETMAGISWLWSLVSGSMRIAVVGLQALVVLGITTVWLARRRDPIFVWLFLLGATSLAFTLASWVPEVFIAANGQSYLVFFLAGFGLMAVGLALAIIGRPSPRPLKIAVGAVPAVLMAGSMLSLLPPQLSALAGSAVAVGGQATAAALLARHSLRSGEWGHALLVAPFALTAWYGIRDIAIVAGAIEGGLLLSGHLRPVMIVAILTLLMRRLATSLDELDGVNETLRQRLAAREKELSELHAKESLRATKAAREDERGRLMRDLHDGVSGHLVSIIALSEGRAGHLGGIEKAARAALEDLRLVIDSLDLDDGDLLLALAGLRERLEPQLRRLGIALDWSMEMLPQVSGVTPGNALSILRILQEAVTNALKHGQPRRIAVQGAAGRDGFAVLRIGNDGADGGPPGKGHGLRNMERRAAALGGGIALAAHDGYALLTLRLPPHLAEG